MGRELRKQKIFNVFQIRLQVMPEMLRARHAGPLDVSFVAEMWRADYSNSNNSGINAPRSGISRNRPWPSGGSACSSAHVWPCGT